MAKAMKERFWVPTAIGDGIGAKFIQIAISTDEGIDSLYALDEEGGVWMYGNHLKPAHWFRLHMERIVEVEDDG